MAYRTIDRTSSGIVFFGPATTDSAFESSSNFRIDTANSRAILSNLTVADGGKIGSASQTGILTLGSDGVATFLSGVVVNGNLTINGTTTTINTETLTIDDNIIVLNNNFTTGTPTENAGVEIRRGSSASVAFRWNETSDFWEFTNDGTTYFEIASRTGNQTLLNKTIDGNNNTLQNIGNASLTNSSVTVTAGNGLINGGSVSLGGSTTLNVGAGNGISVAADAVAVDYDDSTIGLVASKLAVKTSGITNVQLNASVISGQTAITTVDGTADFLLIWDATDSLLKRVNRANFVTGLGTMSSFTVSADGGASQTINDANTLSLLGGSGIVTTASDTDTVTIDINTDNTTLEVSADVLRVKDNGISNAKLRDSSGLSVIGRSANTSGDPADIVSSTDGHVLRQSGTTLGFGTVATAGLADGAVTEIKITRSVAAVSTTSTLSSDINLCTAGAGGITVTLPTVASGKMVIVKKIDTGAGNVIVQRGGVATIDGANTIQLYYQYESVTLVSDGTNWFIV